MEIKTEFLAKVFVISSLTRFKFKTQPVKQQIENIDQSNTNDQ